MKESDVCRAVEIEMEDCILCGVCAELAPQVFTLKIGRASCRERVCHRV